MINTETGKIARCVGKSRIIPNVSLFYQACGVVQEGGDAMSNAQ